MPNLPAPITSPDNLGSSAGITAYANARTSAADAFILKLGQLASTLTPPTIEAVFPTANAAPPIALPTVPPFAQIVWTAPGLPTAFTEQLNVANLLPQPFDATPPTLAFGTAPAAFTDALPDAPGVDLSFEMPTLSLSLPSPPSLLSLNIQKFDGINLPAAPSDDIPVLTAMAPSVREYEPGQRYTSELLSAMQAELKDRIVNGGTGLKPEIEGAIWDRAREREFRSQADALAELERMEGLGYALPPGVYTDARLKIQTETNYTTAGLSREIAIKQAELEQENVNKALGFALQLEGSLLTYTNQVEQRTFDSCKYVTEAGIQLYNAKVQAYTAYLDAYKTKVAIYEAQIRGELARVDVYKSQIAAEQAKADINKSLVEEYRILSEVSLSSIEIYKAEIGAIQTRAEIEKLKVSIFGEQVRGYAAKVNAYTAGVEGFRAEISAEAAKQEAFKSQVQAYSAQVDAAVKTVEANIEVFKGKLAAKNVEYDAFKAAVEGEKARVQGLASVNQATAESYRATVQGVSAFNETLTKQWQVALEQSEKVAEIGIQSAKANAELFVTTRSIITDAAKVGAQVSAQLGASALGAIHWSQSFNFSQANSFSSSDSYSTSYATSNSENKNYNYSV